MCTASKKTVILPAVWASPMVFEVLVLICFCWNAIDRPRGKDTALTRVLYRDGLVFLSSLTLLRTFNLVMAAVARPTLVLVGVFFVWAMTTLVLNRSLLNILKAGLIRRANSNGDQYIASRTGQPSRASRAHSVATTLSIIVGTDELDYDFDPLEYPETRNNTWGIEMYEHK